MSITIEPPTVFIPRKSRQAQALEARGPATDFWAYLRVSTEEQARDGYGMAASRIAIEAWATATGKNILGFLEEPAQSAKDTANRDVLLSIYANLDAGNGHGIVVSRLDRLVRSNLDFALLMLRCKKSGWGVAALDIGLDMSTPHGELIATFVAGMAQWERRIIGERTVIGLEAARANGVRLGRPADVPEELIYRIFVEVDEDPHHCWARIARMFNEEEIPTLRGGKTWYPATIRGIFYSQAAVDLANKLKAEAYS